ncbi:MAG: right-handed parallel beta-helix repeat-containing protein, partial [Desulfobacterales bacterium]|nr:right-handed parallel beta-helix repeat-containing protein [Desulfobacterales bacterium]
LNLAGNTVYANARGIYCRSYRSTLNLDVTDNQAYQNTNGIYITNDHSYTLNTLVAGNTVHDNTQQGIYCRAYKGTVHTEIRGNTVYSNTGHGVQVTRSYSSIHPVITLNTIYDNTGKGIQCTANNPADILFNNIHSNQDNGIYINDSGPGSQVSYNNINTNSGSYELENNNATSIDAGFNYWGDALTQEMAAGSNPKNISRIFDIYDDSTKGTVYYSPWMTSEVTLPDTSVSKITAPLDGNAQKSRQVDIKGIAVSPNGVDYVEVSPDGGVTWYRAQGTHTWSYTHEMPGNGTYPILSRVIDKASNIESPGTGVQVTIDSTLPTTTGSLEADETWTGDVTLTGDVTVPEGITLTLSPGTKIQFLAFSDDQGAGENTSRSELIVNGTLDAQGTQASPIVFTSSSATPDKGDWYGIRVSNATDNNTLTLDYCTIEYSTLGLDIRATADTGIQVTHTTITQTQGNGIYLYGENGAAVTADISNNQITHNDGHGVYTYIRGTSTSLAGTIGQSTLAHNGGYGAHVHIRDYAQANMDVTGNTIHNNTDNGIHAYAQDTYTVISELNLAGNTVYANARGIYCRSYRSTLNLDVTDNQAYQNTNGIYITNDHS